MYSDQYSENIVKKLTKLRKKDQVHYKKVRTKMDLVLANPQHGYKFLHYDLKSVFRVHLGHFVLVFIIDHSNKVVSFEDYDHHDNIYK